MKRNKHLDDTLNLLKSHDPLFLNRSVIIVKISSCYILIGVIILMDNVSKNFLMAEVLPLLPFETPLRHFIFTNNFIKTLRIIIIRERLNKKINYQLQIKKGTKFMEIEDESI